MSDPSRQHGEGPGHGQVRSEEDRISTGTIVAVGASALLLFTLAAGVTLSWLRVKEGDRPPLPVPPELGRSKIGLVEQQLFEVAGRGDQDRTARLERLRTYGWVDRQAGIVRVPIDRAMELVVNGERAATPPRTGKKPEGQP
jgi:hypothetical protein